MMPPQGARKEVFLKSQGGFPMAPQQYQKNIRQCSHTWVKIRIKSRFWMNVATNAWASHGTTPTIPDLFNNDHKWPLIRQTLSQWVNHSLERQQCMNLKWACRQFLRLKSDPNTQIGGGIPPANQARAQADSVDSMTLRRDWKNLAWGWLGG